MLSSSVQTSLPLTPQQKPVKANCLMNSQPKAPAPTKNNLKRNVKKNLEEN